MISDGSCDTDDAENSVLITGINYILQNITMENRLQYYRFYCIFDQVNASLVTSFKQIGFLLMFSLNE